MSICSCWQCCGSECAFRWPLSCGDLQCIAMVDVLSWECQWRWCTAVDHRHTQTQPQTLIHPLIHPLTQWYLVDWKFDDCPLQCFQWSSHRVQKTTDYIVWYDVCTDGMHSLIQHNYSYLTTVTKQQQYNVSTARLRLLHAPFARHNARITRRVSTFIVGAVPSRPWQRPLVKKPESS